MWIQKRTEVGTLPEVKQMSIKYSSKLIKLQGASVNFALICNYFQQASIVDQYFSEFDSHYVPEYLVLNCI